MLKSAEVSIKRTKGRARFITYDVYSMERHAEVGLFDELGREAGCMALAQAFYGRVASEPELKELFPGKSLRCATEAFAAFLVQFFEGSEECSQPRWWLSLRESHAKFRISESQRLAWLKCMNVALEFSLSEPWLRDKLRDFFESASSYIAGGCEAPIRDRELDMRWNKQVSLDRLISDLTNGRSEEAIAAAAEFSALRSVFIGILARMMRVGNEPLIKFVLNSIEVDSELAHTRNFGRTLLHIASGAGSAPVVRSLLSRGVNPDIFDGGNYTPLYRVANECPLPVGAEVVRDLIRAGATVDHCAGITRSTALHAAARRGHLPVLKALLEVGASVTVRDTKGFTPYDRAMKCRRNSAAIALQAYMV